MDELKTALNVMKWIKEITRILYSLIAHVDRTLFNINVHFKKQKTYYMESMKKLNL